MTNNQWLRDAYNLTRLIARLWISLEMKSIILPYAAEDISAFSFRAWLLNGASDLGEWVIFRDSGCSVKCEQISRIMPYNRRADANLPLIWRESMASQLSGHVEWYYAWAGTVMGWWTQHADANNCNGTSNGAWKSSLFEITNVAQTVEQIYKRGFSYICMLYRTGQESHCSFAAASRETPPIWVDKLPAHRGTALEGESWGKSCFANWDGTPNCERRRGILLSNMAYQWD